MEKGSEGLPTLIYPLDNCFETEIITTEHACIFKHCSFKTTFVSHVLIKALVEIKEKCMAAGGWGIAPLLQKSNFCEPKRPNNFCNLSRRNFDRLSNNDQLFRFRTLTSCYVMLCYIYPYFKHRLCLHNYASKTLALRPFRKTYTQLCDNNLVSIPSNL